MPLNGYTGITFCDQPLQHALEKMTEVSEHIDATKRKYDTAIYVQEVQSLIRGWEVSMISHHTFVNFVVVID